MAFYWTDTAVTPQNYCQISRTHEQIKLVKENLFVVHTGKGTRQETCQGKLSRLYGA